MDVHPSWKESANCFSFPVRLISDRKRVIFGVCVSRNTFLPDLLHFEYYGDNSEFHELKVLSIIMKEFLQHFHCKKYTLTLLARIGKLLSDVSLTREKVIFMFYQSLDVSSKHHLTGRSLINSINHKFPFCNLYILHFCSVCNSNVLEVITISIKPMTIVQLLFVHISFLSCLFFLWWCSAR